jgi:aquaporin Z
LPVVHPPVLNSHGVWSLLSKFSYEGESWIYRGAHWRSFSGHFGWYSAAVAARCSLQRLALAFGLTVLTMAYAIGHISGAHLNPAVSLGLAAGKRFAPADLAPYIVAQVIGGIAAAGVLYVIASGKAGFDISSGFASNGYAEHSPGGYSLLACLVAEVVLTFFFLMIIMGATDRRAPAGFAPIAIGLGLTLIHLIGIPVTNLSVNPARSTGPAIFVGGWALAQLWLFWVAPIIGGVAGGAVYAALFESKAAQTQIGLASKSRTVVGSERAAS